MLLKSSSSCFSIKNSTFHPKRVPSEILLFQSNLSTFQQASAASGLRAVCTWSALPPISLTWTRSRESRWGDTVQSSLLITPGQSPCWPHSAARNTHFTESRSEAYQHLCTDPWLPVVTNCCVPQPPGHLLHPATASSCAREKGQLGSSGYTEIKRSLWSGAGGMTTGFLSMDSNLRTARKSATFVFCNHAGNSCLPFLWINQVMFCRGLWRYHRTFWMFFSMPICSPAQKRSLSQHPLQMIRQWTNTTSAATVTGGEEINPSGPPWLLWCAKIYGP